MSMTSAFVVKPKGQVKLRFWKDLVTRKQYSCLSASTTCTMDDLVSIPRDKSCVNSLLHLIPFYVSTFYIYNVCLYYHKVASW
jgi:hypothetical protein